MNMREKNVKKKNIKDDYILVVAAVSLLILSGFLVFWFSSGHFFSSVSAPKIIGEASLTIDFSNGEERTFNGGVVENENLLNILNQAAKAGNLNYKLDGENNISAIEAFGANKTKTWQWYVNGKKTEKPFYEIIVRPNDEILVKYVQ